MSRPLSETVARGLCSHVERSRRRVPRAPDPRVDRPAECISEAFQQLIVGMFLIHGAVSRVGMASRTSAKRSRVKSRIGAAARASARGALRGPAHRASTAGGSLCAAQRAGCGRSGVKRSVPTSGTYPDRYGTSTCTDKARVSSNYPIPVSGCARVSERPRRSEIIDEVVSCNRDEGDSRMRGRDRKASERGYTTRAGRV